MANLANYRVLLGVKEDSSGETIYAAYESRVADLERSSMSTEEKARAMRLLEDALFVLQDRARHTAGDGALSLPHAVAPWGVPVVYVWGAAIVLSLLIRLVLRENTVATYLLLNSLSFGSVFLVNSFIVARRLGDATNVRYPMRDPVYADKWRYKLMKRMTGPAAVLLLLDLGLILFYGALGHWELTGHRRHLFGATIMIAAITVFVNGWSIAALVWGLGPDD